MNIIKLMLRSSQKNSISSEISKYYLDEVAQRFVGGGWRANFLNHSNSMTLP